MTIHGIDILVWTKMVGQLTDSASSGGFLSVWLQSTQRTAVPWSKDELFKLLSDFSWSVLLERWPQSSLNIYIWCRGIKHPPDIYLQSSFLKSDQIFFISQLPLLSASVPGNTHTHTPFSLLALTVSECSDSFLPLQQSEEAVKCRETLCFDKP